MLAELKQCLQTVAGSLESKSKTAKVEFMHSRKSKLLIAKAFDDVMNNVSKEKFDNCLWFNSWISQ